MSCNSESESQFNTYNKTKAIRDKLDMKTVLTNKASSLVWEDNTVFKCLSKCVLVCACVCSSFKFFVSTFHNMNMTNTFRPKHLDIRKCIRDKQINICNP